jgi:hypothetical protein
MKTYEVRPLFGRWGIYAYDQFICFFDDEETATKTADNLNNANCFGVLRPSIPAKWVPLKTKGGRFICSNCCYGTLVKMNFCANCGAKMDWSN